MREYTLQGTNYQWNIKYPESTIWLQDNNVIRVDGTAAGTGVEIDITANASGEVRTLRYMGQLSYIVFSLDDTLLNIYREGDMSYSITIRVYRNMVLDGTFSFPITLLNGKSYPNRSHGADRTIYIYDTEMLRKVKIWSETAGVLYINHTPFSINAGYNALFLQGVITQPGMYHCCFGTGLRSPSVRIESVLPVTTNGGVVNLSFTPYTPSPSRSDEGKGGDVWDKTRYDIDSWCIDIVYDEVCGNDNTLIFHYLNADGFDRYIAGKILDETIKNDREPYFRMSDSTNIRNYPLSHITSDQRTVKVGFDDIAKDAYLIDICSSPLIEYLNYAGEWEPCVCATDKLSVGADDSQDYEIEFCLNRE